MSDEIALNAETNVTSVRLGSVHLAVLDAVAAPLSERMGVRVGRGTAVRYLLKRVTPPTDLGSTARKWREAHHNAFSDTP